LNLLAANSDDPLLHQLRQVHVEQLLLPVLIQLIVILLAARLFAVGFRKIGQPAVVGEIAAGLVLGPSVLGAMFPQIARAIFHPGIANLDPDLADAILNHIFTVLSQLGLILLLFLVGLEFDFSYLRWHGKAAVASALTGVAFPFLLGVCLAWFMWPDIDREIQTGDQVGFMLFIGLTLSITALPILGRIMIELGITRTRLAAITISAAAVDDAVGWIMLAAVAAVVRARFDPAAILVMIGSTIGFVGLIIVAVRPLLLWWIRGLQQAGGSSQGLNSLAVLLAVILLCAVATNLIGIFAIFGAFLAGAVLSGESEFRKAVSARLSDLVTVFFLPIFFTYTGLRTDIGTLSSPILALFCVLVLLAAVVGKLAGCGVAVWLAGFPAREAALVGVMMNTRGLMGLIAINVGRELGVISSSVYCMLVIMALGTTVMTTPLLLRLMPGTELEPYILRSGFLGPAFSPAPPRSGNGEVPAMSEPSDRADETAAG
jgi:Kef-type K+ transport system membrane component KefB